MKKFLLILFALLAFCGCEIQEEPVFEEINPGENCVLPEEPEVIPIPEDENKLEIPSKKFSFEKPEILYPEFLTEELSSSPAFKKAMEKPSVIIYEGEPLTDCIAAVNFVEAFEKNEYAEFYLYSFYCSDFDGSKSLYCQHFTTDEGTVYRAGDILYNWESGFKLNEKTLHGFVDINEYGYFELGWEWGDSTFYKVISDFALYENEAEHRALKEKYIDPIFTITVSPQDFNSVSEISEKLLWLFEDIYNYENGCDPWQEFGNNWPVSEILSLLNRYFEGVTKEMLVSVWVNRHYDPETETIYYEGGRGGVPPERRIFDFEENGDELILYYEIYNTENGKIFKDEFYELKIKILPDGSFRYLSQEIIVRTEETFKKQAVALTETFAELMVKRNYEPVFEPSPDRFFIKFAEFMFNNPSSNSGNLPYIGFVWESENIYHFSALEMEKIAFELFGIKDFEPFLDYENNFEYVPEMDEFVSSLEFGTEPVFGSKDFSVSESENIFKVKFTLIDSPFFPGTDEYGEYEAVFELVDESYLRFIKLEKAGE